MRFGLEPVCSKKKKKKKRDLVLASRVKAVLLLPASLKAV